MGNYSKNLSMEMTCTEMLVSSFSYFSTSKYAAEIHALNGCLIKNNVYSLHLLSSYFVTDPVLTKLF